ncbi:unnamed protein product [Ostreobium quekettii]|uniref:Protein kinase domain-containing protein n=1 Tax=Ostreobium quekettii TaxID=121088 RepID=A0A8S1IJS5_9CHLO|nr:unnamed protein product [Ostreobium quekettii]
MEYRLPVVHKLESLLLSSERMIKRHASRFDVLNFYTVSEARWVVQTICQNLRGVLQVFDLTVEDAVPDADAEQDSAFLEHHLKFVVDDGDDCNDLQQSDSSATQCNRSQNGLHEDRKDADDSDPFGDEWHEVKRGLQAQLARLSIVTEDAIDCTESTEIGASDHSTMYKSVWQGQEVAVKRLVLVEQGAGKYEQMAQFLMEAALNAPMSHPNVARVLAVVRSGLIILELASESLFSWYQHGWVADWGLKIQVAHQAALRLAHLHAHRIIHRDVKSCNFLVFPPSSGDCAVPVVKLCDLGIAVGQSEEWRVETTKRQQPGTKKYLAPEIDAGKAHNPQSHVFSFGAVLCEVVV